MSELSPETRDLIARGREGIPSSPRRRAVIHAAVLAEAATLAAPVAAATWWTSLAAKIIVVGSVAIVGTVGTVAILKSSRAIPVETRVAEQPAASSSASAPASALPPAELASPAVVSAVIAPVNAPVNAPLEENVSPRPTSPSRDPSVGKTDLPTLAPFPEAPRASVASTNANAGSTDFPPPPSSVRSGAPASPPQPARSSLEEEVSLLRDAHRALAAGDVDQSLRLLDEHERKFPSSALEPERSAERVFALCQAQRVSAARTSANAFLARHGDGPLAARVRGSCVKQGP